MIEVIKQSGSGSGGITSLNGLTASTQFLAAGTSGTDFAISSSVDTNTFNLPTASAINRGALSAADWTTFNSKGNGTVTSVQALTLGTTGTDLSSSVANGSTVPVITLNVPTASAINRGALSSADWTTFNGKQATLVSGTNIKTINSSSILGSGNLVVAAAPSGVSGAVQFSDGSALASDATNFFWDNANDRLGLGTNTPLGILHLKTAAATTRMVIDGAAAQNKIITYRTNGLQRFGLYTDNTAESGSNVGSDFKIRAYSDAGSLLTTPLFIKRSTGNIGINTTTAISAKLNIAGSGATNATKSIFIQNSATTETFSISDSGIGLISNSLGINGGVGGSTYLGQTMRLAVNDFSRFGDIRIGGGFGSTIGYIQSDGTNAIEFSSAQIKFCNGWVAQTNVLKIGTTLERGRIEINTLSNYRGILIQADAAQVVPLVEFKNNANTVLSYIAAKGEFYFGSGTVSASAAIQADSTTQGFLPPRMTTVQKNAIVTPAAGLMVYDTTLAKLCVYTTAWETITSV